MNLFIKILLMFAISYLFPFNSYGQENKCKLKILTNRDSASIYINGNYSGKGNIELLLSKGTYIVKAEESNKIWNGKVLIDTVLFEDSGMAKTIRFTFDSLLYLDTFPEDASVFKNDSLLGNTPFFVRADIGRLNIEKSGYSTKQIYSDSLLKGSEVKLNFTGTRNGRSFFEKGIFKTLVTGIIILGGTTAYFKLKADNRYSEYQATGDQVKLDATRKFDLISGITMGALEINFGLLIYFFLSD